MHPLGVKRSTNPSNFSCLSTPQVLEHGEKGKTHGEVAQSGVLAKISPRMFPDASPASHSPDAKAQGAWCCPPFFQCHNEKKATLVPQNTPRGTVDPSVSDPPTPIHCSTYCRMNWMASSYFIPLSIKASATRTGALKGNRSSGHSPTMWPRG